VAGRFSKRHKRYIREEENKFNKQVMDILLVQMSLLASSGSLRLSENARVSLLFCRGGASLKFIKNSFKILSYHHHNGNVLNRTSMDIGPFITKLLDET
jgi:hypothetical protein